MSGYGGGQLAAAFTVSQWHELEHQVLIFKYLRAGLPVPPDLLAPIRTSLHLLSSSLFHHSHAHPRPTLGYCSYDGKKIDPEPGRCRRTDGKKWRCSKDAHPSSKYCERHMNRNRYRSRKPVESRTASQTGSLSTGNSSGSSGSSQNPPLHSIGNHEALCFRSNVSRSDMDPTPYRISSTDYRSLQGLKAEADDGVISVGLESAGLLSTNSSMNSAWHLSISPSPANSLSDERNGAFLQNSCPPLHMLQNFDPQITNSRISKQQQQHYFFGREFGSSRSVKQENLSFQPLPDELPKTIDFGCYMDDQRAKNSLCTTQLSMAIPMASSECFGNSANSSKDASMDKFLS